MTSVYSEFSVQFHPWNSGIRFTRKTGDNGHWIIVDQDRSRVLSMYFPGASDADIDAVVKALNKLLPTAKPLVEPFPFRDPEAIEL